MILRYALQHHVSIGNNSPLRNDMPCKRIQFEATIASRQVLLMVNEKKSSSFFSLANFNKQYRHIAINHV